MNIYDTANNLAREIRESDVFKKLKDLSVDINARKFHNIEMDLLSMGMSNDYEIAISQGATFVRVGTAIFGVRGRK